ncbi:uncharacterized protein LOC123546730 [Mercenaria mercenaria]|uniref:uncharacterized protein LOC123546730 n=1 Tax=Mercenaria mercenaria TaxID=6596 RepID=UPI00234F3A9D|nr:uncharacterized protein LOC123546730 [Mercenaria mercenaria]XP_045189176.2 uncharacterized protein LOC123546730 [Mercenaria mercenaria]XP_045189177.2 uncharacterized protein LOC123546730 [Mercenaria mercenaria]XP_045189178.2 uncharacterized protein LOC123546730 [Mercenaria mercenaria]
MRRKGFLVAMVIVCVVDRLEADHPKDKLAKEPTKPRVGCTKLLFEGKGDFRLQKKIYPAQNVKHYIESLRLLKRTSFYKCEPRIEKYGISEDGHSWWVDKGCEAIFEVTECPNNGKMPPPDTWRTMYEELRKRLKEATQNVDLTNFNLNSVFNRFEYQPEPTVQRN